MLLFNYVLFLHFFNFIFHLLKTHSSCFSLMFICTLIFFFQFKIACLQVARTQIIGSLSEVFVQIYNLLDIICTNQIEVNKPCVHDFQIGCMCLRFPIICMCPRFSIICMCPRFSIICICPRLYPFSNACMQY